MTQTTDLANEACIDLPKGTPALEPDALRALLPEGWMVEDGRLTRRYSAKTFAAAMAVALQAGQLAEEAGHHPDITFGWGYCELRYWTHSIGGLSRNDLIAAAKMNAAGLGT